jgi:hypothetical protein
LGIGQGCLRCAAVGCGADLWLEGREVRGAAGCEQRSALGGVGAHAAAPGCTSPGAAVALHPRETHHSPSYIDDTPRSHRLLPPCEKNKKLPRTSTGAPMSAPEFAASLNPFSHAGWNSGGMLLPMRSFT